MGGGIINELKGINLWGFKSHCLVLGCVGGG